KPLAPGKIRDSNSTVVTELVRNERCPLRTIPGATDDRAALSAAVDAGFASRPDLLVTTGGVSAGRLDAVPEILAAAGVEIVFHKVNIKPGMPLLFGMRGDVPVFSLPGNPVSSAVTFLQFVRPAIRKMSGDPDPGSRKLMKAKLAAPITKRDGKRHFVRGLLEWRNGEPTVRPAGAQESNVASTLVAANCLIILPEAKAEFVESEYVETEML